MQECNDSKWLRSSKSGQSHLIYININVHVSKMQSAKLTIAVFDVDMIAQRRSTSQDSHSLVATYSVTLKAPAFLAAGQGKAR